VAFSLHDRATDPFVGRYLAHSHFAVRLYRRAAFQIRRSPMASSRPGQGAAFSDFRPDYRSSLRIQRQEGDRLTSTLRDDTPG